jgi:hypothetical protein
LIQQSDHSSAANPCQFSNLKNRFGGASRPRIKVLVKRHPKDCHYYRRMVQGCQCIFASTIFFGTEDQPVGSRLIEWARFHLFDDSSLVR